ncbi:hypothetical protein C1646_749262 [Rhizophagus diaphanus]|nr:hypothetical protein C1646_749262 [Rhizophagus diaphanus] [Rhizophagus sp. MUCL 43196]
MQIPHDTLSDYQTTEKLNNIANKSCPATYNAKGHVCIMPLNNTVTNRKNNKLRLSFGDYYSKAHSIPPIVDKNNLFSWNSNFDIDP